MALLDFLGDIASGLGPVGGPRGLPMPIEEIDPNAVMAQERGPSARFLQAFGGGAPAANPAVEAAMRAQQPMGGLVAPPPAQQPQQAPQQAMQPVAAPMAKKSGGGFRDFLGQLGDALLIANDIAPIYGPRKEKRELGEAMAQFLGNDPNLAAIALANPEIAAQFYDRSREDKRFDRGAGQEDRRIGVSEADAGTRRGGLYETGRHNRATEALTARGQDTSAGLQAQLARLRSAEAAADREARAALARGDQAHAERMLGLQAEAAQQLALVQAQLGQLTTGQDGGQEVTETLSGDGTSKTTTTRKLPSTPRVTGEAAYKALPSGATFIGPDGKTYRKP